MLKIHNSNKYNKHTLTIVKYTSDILQIYWKYTSKVYLKYTSSILKAYFKYTSQGFPNTILSWG